MTRSTQRDRSRSWATFSGRRCEMAFDKFDWIRLVVGDRRLKVGERFVLTNAAIKYVRYATTRSAYGRPPSPNTSPLACGLDHPYVAAAPRFFRNRVQ